MVEMATKVVYTLREDKQQLQKQFGCMNGIFQLFDRRYLLGLHRHNRNPNRLTPGEDKNGEKESKNSKDKNPKKVIIEKNRASIESSRNSFSSSCSSTTFSSLDCSKRVQTEWQIPSEPTSPNLHNKQPDIKDVVKQSMTREIRVKKVEQVGNVMKHVDSPRPFIHQKHLQYDRKDPKIHKNSVPRFSCDERESQYSLKSTFKVKELPRLSLDSKQNCNKNSMNESRSEPGSNKRPSTGVVARLMGLDNLTDSINEVETLKIKPTFDDQLVSSPRWSRKDDDCRDNHGSVLKKSTLKNTKNAPASIYCEMEKRLSMLEFKTSGKDLRALKQILEKMQMTKTVLENKEQYVRVHSPKTDQSGGSPVINRASSPKNRPVKASKMATESRIITGGNQVKEPASRNKKSTVRSPRSVSPSNSRLQRSKNGVDQQCVHGPSYDLRRTKKQSYVQPVVSHLKTRTPKIKPIKPKNNEKSHDRVSNKLQGTNNNLAAQIKPEVTRNEKENHKNNFDEKFIQEKPTVEEQPSPVSVLDAFYTEDTPSPVKKKATAFNDYENLHDDESEWNLLDANQYSEFIASPYTSMNIDQLYINEILLASGFLKDPDSAIRIVQLHPTTTLIKPQLFHLLESQNDKCYTRYEKITRKMIFDSVNDILFQKLVVPDSFGLRRLGNGEKLVKELWSEIDDLQSRTERCIYDEDDQVKNIVSRDVNKNSEDWDKGWYEVSSVVLDMERLIFKDLIDEVVNAEVASSQDRDCYCFPCRK